MPLPPPPKKPASLLDSQYFQPRKLSEADADPADVPLQATASAAETDSAPSPAAPAPRKTATRKRKAALMEPMPQAEPAVAPEAADTSSSLPDTAKPAGAPDRAAKPARRARKSAGNASAASTPAPAAPVAPVTARTAPAEPQPRVPARSVQTPVRSAPPASQAAPSSAEAPAARKLFVLDTNVLMHDPMSLFRFQEHDIYLALIVLEEMDNHKKGVTEVARNVRQTSRTLDALVEAVHRQDLSDGMPLDATGHREATGRLFFQTEALRSTLPDSLPQGKADNQILGVVAALEQLHPGREVVLVSKDINMRVKARALGLPAEDYQNDKTLDDDELLYNGTLPLPPDFWDTPDRIESWQEGAYTFYRVHGPLAQQMLVNQFVYFEQPGEPSLYARVVEIRGDSAVLKTLRDCTHPKHAAWGVTARNREQNFAMNLLLDPEIDFVTLTGTAGTGKTLLALACGLTQVLDERRYTEIIMTRATVSVGEDIGFLPGTEEEKMGPWMGALDDNLEFLTKGEGSGNGGAGEWGRAATQELVRSRIKIKSMNFMRGRTFMNKFVIIDEAQNLTPKQMKTLITRAGPGTKIICMGNLAQIDTPYLTEGSSGLTAVVDKFKGWPHSGHIMLARGERSRLADFASEVL